MRACPCGSPCCSLWMVEPQWHEATSRLAEDLIDVAPVLAPMLTMRRAMVQKFFGRKISLADVAAQCRMHPNKVADPHRAVREWLKETEGRAWNLFETALRKCGTVGDLSS